MNVTRETLAETANGLGFVLVGFARLRRLQEREDFYRGWIDAGGHAAMDYLARAPQRRFDPRRLDPRNKSVVRLCYPHARPSLPDDSRTIASRDATRGR